MLKSKFFVIPTKPNLYHMIFILERSRKMLLVQKKIKLDNFVLTKNREIMFQLIN